MWQCLSGDDMTERRAVRHSMEKSMMRQFVTRMIFALMDRDGDGIVSLEEFQAAHASIFKAMDADKDGTVSMEEMQDVFHGHIKQFYPQRSVPRD